MRVFLKTPLKSISKKAKIIEMMDIKGINKLKFREKLYFEDHKDNTITDIRKKINMMIMDIKKIRKSRSWSNPEHKQKVKHDDHGHGSWRV